MDSINGSITNEINLTAVVSGSNSVAGAISVEQGVDGSLSVVSGLSGSLASVQAVSGEIAQVGSVTGTITATGISDYPRYDGSYEVTPSDNAQTLNTGNTILTENIVINPVPSTYGRLTWNGAYLTVY